MVVQRECRCLVCELCLKVCRVFVLPCWQNSVFWGNKKYSRNFGVMCFYLLAYVVAPVSPWHRVTSTSAFQKTCKMSIISISLVSTWCKQTEQQYFWHKPVWLPAHPIGYRSLMSGCVSPKVYFLSTAPFFFTYYQHNIITHIDFYTHKKYKVTLTCLFPGGDPDVQLTECDRRSGVHLLHSFPGQSVQGNRHCPQTCFLNLRHAEQASADGEKSERMMEESLERVCTPQWGMTGSRRSEEMEELTITLVQKLF